MMNIGFKGNMIIPAEALRVATVYLAYDPQGKYLGGDVWVGE